MKLIFKIQAIYYWYTFGVRKFRFNKPLDKYFTFTYDYCRLLKKVG